MTRRPFEFYETPPHYLDALLQHIEPSGCIAELCVGEGNIAERLRTLSGVRWVVTNDLDPKRAAMHHYDARTTEFFYRYPRFDWIITNPPFSQELQILANALQGAFNVAFLARLSFLEPTKERALLLKARPPTQVIVLPRYSFRFNDQGRRQTDSVTCCWLIWHADDQSRRVVVWSGA